jgi:hypothetical protein
VRIIPDIHSQRADSRQYKKADDQYKIEQGEYPEHTPHIKVAEKMRFVQAVQQNIGDKEPGKHKEQVDAEPAKKEIVHEPEIVNKDHH